MGTTAFTTTAFITAFTTTLTIATATLSLATATIPIAITATSTTLASTIAIFAKCPGCYVWRHGEEVRQQALLLHLSARSDQARLHWQRRVQLGGSRLLRGSLAVFRRMRRRQASVQLAHGEYRHQRDLQS